MQAHIGRHRWAGKLSLRERASRDSYTVAASLSGFANASKTVQRVYLGQDGTVNFTLHAPGRSDHCTPSHLWSMCRRPRPA